MNPKGQRSDMEKDCSSNTAEEQRRNTAEDRSRDMIDTKPVVYGIGIESGVS